jgi:diaminopimelate decarboxylase
MKRLALVPFMVLALAGCGNKGPLVHPTPPAVPMEEMPMSATTAPAAPTDATPPAETTPPPPPPGGD